MQTKVRVVLQFEKFSVRPQCLCGESFLTFAHHRDTENSEVAQRELKFGLYQSVYSKLLNDLEAK
jgi:hypothetical protein